MIIIKINWCHFFLVFQVDLPHVISHYMLMKNPNNTTRFTPYRIRFRTGRGTTPVDVALLLEGLDNRAGNPCGFSPPPEGLLKKANIKDLFGDYEREAGVRVPRVPGVCRCRQPACGKVCGAVPARVWPTRHPAWGVSGGAAQPA